MKHHLGREVRTLLDVSTKLAASMLWLHDVFLGRSSGLLHSLRSGPASIGRLLTLATLLQPGDHVKVNSGQHEGQTGMVVRIEDPVCILVSDSTHEELQVFARDLTESSESATGLDRYFCCFCWLIS